jgi:hypothetical protein
MKMICSLMLVFMCIVGTLSAQSQEESFFVLWCLLEERMKWSIELPCTGHVSSIVLLLYCTFQLDIKFVFVVFVIDCRLQSLYKLGCLLSTDEVWR